MLFTQVADFYSSEHGGDAGQCVCEGCPLPLGQNQALVRMPRIASSRAAADEMVMKYDVDIFRNFYAAMGRHRVEPEDVPGPVTKYGLWSIGTVEDVRKQLIDEWKQMPAESI